MLCWLIPLLGCLLAGLFGYLSGKAMTLNSARLAKVSAEEVSFIPPDVIKEHGTFQGLNEQYEALRKTLSELEEQNEQIGIELEQFKQAQADSASIKHPTIDDANPTFHNNIKTLSDEEVELIADSKIIRHSAYQSLYRQYQHLQQAHANDSQVVPSIEQVQAHEAYQSLLTEITHLRAQLAEQQAKQQKQQHSDSEQTLNKTVFQTPFFEGSTAENAKSTIDIVRMSNQTSQTPSEKPVLSEEEVKDHIVYRALTNKFEELKSQHHRLEQTRKVLSEQQQALNKAVVLLREENEHLQNQLDAESKSDVDGDLGNISEKALQSIPETKVKLHKTYQTLAGQYNRLLRDLSTPALSEKEFIALKRDKHNLLIENEALKSQLSEVKAQDLSQLSDDDIQHLPEEKLKMHRVYRHLINELSELQEENVRLRQNGVGTEKAQENSELSYLRIENTRLKKALTDAELSSGAVKEFDETDILSIPEKLIMKHRAYRVLVAQLRELQHAYDILSKERSNFVANQIAEKSTLTFDAELASRVFGKAIVADDLTIIEGVGPKIADLLIAENISTWYALSQTSVERCQEILVSAGSHYAYHDASTWPRQAKMAFEGKWQALYTWQERLDGGRESNI